MDLEQLCEELERELSGRRGVISDKIDVAECRRLARAIHEKIIPLTQRMNGIVIERQNMLTNADAVAKNLLSAAEQKAAAMVSGAEVMKKAEAESRKIMDQTYAECDRLVLKSKENLDEILLAAEQKLSDALKEVSAYRYAVKSMIINSSAE